MNITAKQLIACKQLGYVKATGCADDADTDGIVPRVKDNQFFKKIMFLI